MELHILPRSLERKLGELLFCLLKVVPSYNTLVNRLLDDAM
jgi:hypothetical protein